MRLRIVLTFALLATGAVACSDDDDASSFCDDRSALESSVQSLTDFDVAEGTDGLKADVESVKDALSSLKTSGGDEISDEVDAVETSLSSLESGVEGASGVADKASTLASGLADVQTSLQALASAASDTAESCD